MSKKEKTTLFLIAFIVIVIFLLFGRKGTTITNMQDGSPINMSVTGGNVGDFNIEIPSLDMPPRNDGPIIWPTLDLGPGYQGGNITNQYQSTIAGQSTCGCGDGSTAVYYQDNVSSPDPIAPKPVLAQLTRSLSASIGAQSLVAPQPANGYVDARGNVTAGQWW